MARLARVVVPGLAHHVTQRGNRREDVFFSDADRQRYLMLLAGRAEEHGLRLWAYCLMTNHVHLVVVPRDADGLGRAMRAVNSAYVAWVNRRQGLCGHLWQGRFYSCPLDEDHLWSAIRYVDRNPVRAGLVAEASDWAWSSAGPHCGTRPDTLLSNDLPSPEWLTDWQAWLRGEQDEDVAAIRKHTRTGRPLGSTSFIEKLQSALGRRLFPAKRGRKQESKGTSPN